MTSLERLLRIVDDAYPGGRIGVCVDLKTGERTAREAGDTLAEFVAIETIEVGGDGSLKERRIAVAGALRAAVNNLEGVIYALENGRSHK